jgi:hypothetical protein
MTIEEIAAMVKQLDSGITETKNWGERGLFYNPGFKRTKGIYLLTFKEKDGANDQASKLNRPGLYRLNLGLSKTQYTEQFGAPPSRPAAGKTVETGHDFTVVDQITPHPIYGWMSWCAVINPSLATIEIMWPWVADAVQRARQKFK